MRLSGQEKKIEYTDSSLFSPAITRLLTRLRFSNVGGSMQFTKGFWEHNGDAIISDLATKNVQNFVHLK